MFKLKAPCKDCPFRKDKPHQKGWLGSERAMTYKIKSDVLDFFAKNPSGFFTVKQVAKGLGVVDEALYHGVRVSIWELQSAKKIQCRKINNRYRWRFCGIVKTTYENNKPAKVGIL